MSGALSFRAPEANGCAAQKTNLDGSHQPLRIIRMEALSSGGIQTFQQPLHASRPPLFAIHQTGANPFVAFGKPRQAIQQGSQIETGASHHHRQAPAIRDLANDSAGDPRVLTSGVTVGRVQHVQQMVAYTPALRCWSLGSTHMEATVELEGIAIDDLA